MKYWSLILPIFTLKGVDVAYCYKSNLVSIIHRGNPMAKSASPIRLQEDLMQAAALTGERFHRSTAEQIEYWAEMVQVKAHFIARDWRRKACHGSMPVYWRSSFILMHLNCIVMMLRGWRNTYDFNCSRKSEVFVLEQFFSILRRSILWRTQRRLGMKSF